ncbi:zinc finger and SCAN domain-containing protein 31-like [Tiliqua scincoides]|uniref:zinc finger and SCAN domain-containing protein 31-like n=1 Tax=Tiliqua scincoides TaxID=71010 RepID=UPI0034628C7D
MATAVTAQDLSFQAQLEQNIKREEQVQASLGFGRRERAALFEEHLGWGFPQVEPEKRGAPQSWEAGRLSVKLGSATPAWNNLQLPPLTPEDDAEAYLATFERVAEACRWPRDEWTSRLALALSGSARQAYGILNACDAKEYEKLKEAILRGYHITPETWRLWFRQFRYPEAGHPLEVCGQLRELCYQWLEPERHTKEQILELLVLEQFVTVLPPETQSWVRERDPETCRQAIALVEDYLLNQAPKHQKAKKWEQQEVTRGSCERESAASGAGARLPCQEVGFKSDIDSSLQGDGMISGERELKIPVRESNEMERFKRMAPARCSDDLSQGQVSAHWVRTVKDVTRLTREKDTSTALHDTGHQKVLGMNVGSRMRVHSKSFGRPTEPVRDKGAHPGEQPYQCPKCRRRFSANAAFHQHLQSHFAEKRYQCTVCEMRFRQSSDLIKHQRIHTGEKPYQCLECGKTFSLSSALYRHCRGHSGEKPFQCKECGKSFTRNSNLAQHHRLHKK